MTYWRTAREVVRGDNQPRGPHISTHDTQRAETVIQFTGHVPPGSCDSRRLRAAAPFIPSLERSGILQALFDITAVVVGTLLVTLTGLAIAGSVFILFFVRV